MICKISSNWSKIVISRFYLGNFGSKSAIFGLQVLIFHTGVGPLKQWGDISVLFLCFSLKCFQILCVGLKWTQKTFLRKRFLAKRANFGTSVLDAQSTHFLGLNWLSRRALQIWRVSPTPYQDSFMAFWAILIYG